LTDFQIDRLKIIKLFNLSICQFANLSI